MYPKPAGASSCSCLKVCGIDMEVALKLLEMLLGWTGSFMPWSPALAREKMTAWFSSVQTDP